MKKSVIVLTLLAAAALAAQADQRSNISAEHSSCYDKVELGGFKNSQWAACDDAELLRLDKKLNLVYGKVRGAMDASQKSQMTKGQKAWLDYRESWCRYLEAANLLAPSGRAQYTSCMVSMTDQKINELLDLESATK